MGFRYFGKIGKENTNLEILLKQVHISLFFSNHFEKKGPTNMKNLNKYLEIIK